MILPDMQYRERQPGLTLPVLFITYSLDVLLIPLKQHLAALAGLHDVETLLEIGNGEAVCDDGAEVKT